MPTDDDRDANNNPAEPPEEPTAPAATPTFALSRDDLQNIFREAISATQPQRPNQPYVEPTPEAASEDEWQSNPKDAARKDFAAMLHPLRQEMAQFRTFGLERLAELTDKSFSGDLPYRNEYRAEIDAELVKLDPALRTNKDTIRLVHDAVAMRHETERLAKARDEGLRQGRGNAPAPSGVRPDPNAPKVATPEELFDSTMVEEINQRGGPDAFARRVSDGRFKNWSDYAAARARMDAAPSKMGARGPAKQIVFARLGDKKAAAAG